jgi:hypothetical protein
VSGRTLKVTLGATTNGVSYTLPVTITDTVAGRVHNAVIDPGLLVNGRADIAGVKQGVAVIEDIFGIGAANLSLSYSFEQLSEPFQLDPVIESSHGADVPVINGDSLGTTGLKLITPYTSAARELTVEFTPGGLDTVNTLFNRIVPYLNVVLREEPQGTLLQSGVDYTFTGQGIRRTGGSSFTTDPNRYYLSGLLSNGETWDCGHLLSVYNWSIAFDFADHGVGSGKPSPSFTWGSTHQTGTRDFQAGDKVTLSWSGGVKAVFPKDVVITLIGAPAGRTEVTQEMMEGIRIVPNPYLIRHEAQRGAAELYFNFLPEECTIRIYTLALDLVKTIHHTQGSRETWNLTTEGGQLIASQLLIAHIESTNGLETVKKFAVVVGK